MGLQSVIAAWHYPLLSCKTPGHVPITFRLPPFHPHGFARQSNLSVLFPPCGYCTYCSLCPKCVPPNISWVASPSPSDLCLNVNFSMRPFPFFLFKIQLYSDLFSDLWFSKYYTMYFITSYIWFVTYVLAGTFVCFVHCCILPAQNCS